MWIRRYLHFFCELVAVYFREQARCRQPARLPTFSADRISTPLVASSESNFHSPNTKVTFKPRVQGKKQACKQTNQPTRGQRQDGHSCVEWAVSDTTSGFHVPLTVTHRLQSEGVLEGSTFAPTSPGLRHHQVHQLGHTPSSLQHEIFAHIARKAAVADF